MKNISTKPSIRENPSFYGSGTGHYRHIFDPVDEALNAVDDQALVAAVRCAFEAERASVTAIENVFLSFTSNQWPPDAVRRFFHGWRDTHLSAGSVAAITCRLLARAEAAPPVQAIAFHHAAEENSKIIHEDLGMVGETHAELYYRLATAACQGDEWESRAYCSENTTKFRQWVHDQRVHEKDLGNSLITTIASEIYNHGEYSFVLMPFANWLHQSLGLTADVVRRNMAYIKVHTGETESGHFMHGVSALKFYCEGEKSEINYSAIEEGIRQYLQRVAIAVGNLAGSIH